MGLAKLGHRVERISVKVGTDVATERIRGRKLDRIRKRILLRDGYTCQMCGRVSSRLEVDHRVPLHLGGSESDENRWSLCLQCHQAKTEQEEKDRR